MSDIELKRCPFCGCESWEMTHKKVFPDGAWGYKIRCEKCGSQGCWWHTKKEAVDTWNTRPEVDRLEALNAELVSALGDVANYTKNKTGRTNKTIYEYAQEALEKATGDEK